MDKKAVAICNTRSELVPKLFVYTRNALFSHKVRRFLTPCDDYWLCPRVPVHKGITVVFSLFRSLWLAVMYCLVFCIGSCVPVHEDRTRLLPVREKTLLLRYFDMFQTYCEKIHILAFLLAKSKLLVCMLFFCLFLFCLFFVVVLFGNLRNV